jgi:competence protein ComEA
MLASLRSRLWVAWLWLAAVASAGLVLGYWLLVVNAPPHNAVIIEPVGTRVAAATLPDALRTAEPTVPAALSPPPTAATPNLPASPTATPSPIGVYVSGAVARPGIYYLPPGSRVADAIEAAGGFLPAADRSAVNLALRLRDEEQVDVPEVGAARSPAPPQPRASATTPPGGRAPTAARPVSTINLNSATQAELETLPSIGPALAARIVEHRLSNGPFAAIDDIVNVPGIGESILERIRPFVTVEP